MSIEEYNEELTKIKQFHAYLTSILDSGYMNEIEDLKSLTKQINNINISTNNLTSNYNHDYDDNNIDSDYDCIPFLPSRKKKLSSSNNTSSDDTSSDTEDETEYKLQSNSNKEQEKINRFINSNINDIYQQCGNISLYKANGFDYIDDMKKFIKKSFIY